MKAVLVILAALACLYRMHVTVTMGGASLSMTGLAWMFAAATVAVAAGLVLVVRKAVTEGPWIVPRRRIA